MKYNFNMKITIDLKSKIILEFTFLTYFPWMNSLSLKKWTFCFSQNVFINNKIAYKKLVQNNLGLRY